MKTTTVEITNILDLFRSSFICLSLMAITNLLDLVKILFQDYHEIVPFTLAFMTY